MKACQYFTLLLISTCAFAQKIDHTVSYRSMDVEGYLRINYENDFFADTDQDYTQGYNIEIVTPGLHKNPVNFLFVSPKTAESQFGISIEQPSYTPFHIKKTKIQYGERPFACAIMLKSFEIATDTLHHARWVSSLSAGLIGQGAFGKEMQVAFHKITGSLIPGGWKNQICNDVVLNYELAYEKQLLWLRNIFSLQGSAAVKAGTLFTNASLGMNATLGFINTPFAGRKSKKKFTLYAFAHPQLNAIGYDATLQGGLFNRSSPYTIPDTAIERFTAQFSYGLILQTDKTYLEYSQFEMTKEFDLGETGAWGGIRIGFVF